MGQKPGSSVSGELGVVGTTGAAARFGNFATERAIYDVWRKYAKTARHNLGMLTTLLVIVTASARVAPPLASIVRPALALRGGQLLAVDAATEAPGSDEEAASSPPPPPTPTTIEQGAVASIMDEEAAAPTTSPPDGKLFAASLIACVLNLGAALGFMAGSQGAPASMLNFFGVALGAAIVAVYLSAA